MNNEAMFSSNKSDWETPQDVFDNLDDEFSFDLDVCASDDNAKCAKYYTSEINGLDQRWEGVCWMNPPYGREISKWIEKAFMESLLGSTVVCLLPARTDTNWFHKYVQRADEIRFLRGRLKFVGAKNAAPFPSMVVVFRSKAELAVLEYIGNNEDDSINWN